MPTQIGFKEIFASIGSPSIKLVKSMDLALGTLMAALVPERRRGRLPDKIQNILIIRPGGIGDAVFLIPFIKILRREYSSLTIDILGERRNSAVFSLEDNLVQNIYHYDSWKAWPAIFKKKYDVVIETEQWHYLSALVAYFLNPKYSIGFATRPLRSKLFDLKIPYDLNAYEMNSFYDLFKPLLHKDTKAPEVNHCLKLSDDTLSWAESKIQKNTVALFIGASIPLRRLSHEQCLEIIQPYLKKNFNVILLGGRDVVAVAERLTQEVKDQRLINFVGKTTLQESAALIQKSQRFIGTDSGLMHVACAVGTPTVGIFGPGNLGKWGLQGNQHQIISDRVSCSPCTHFGYTVPTCGGSYHCMRELKLDLSLKDR